MTEDEKKDDYTFDSHTVLWLQSINSLPRTKGVEWLGELLDDYHSRTHSDLRGMEDEEGYPVCANCCVRMERNVEWYSISAVYGRRRLMYCCSTKCMKKLGRR